MRPQRTSPFSWATLSLFLTLLAAAASWGFTKGEPPGTNFTSSNGIYLISSATDLNKLAQFVNDGGVTGGYTFRQTANITLSGDFTPIGFAQTSSGNTFAGTYDGNNYTISGLNINVDDNAYPVGLFGITTGNATIKNVTLISPTVFSDHGSAGGIVGSNNATISNCTIEDGSIEGSSAGGITSSNAGTITNCQVKGVTIKGKTSHAGGISASNLSTISKCETRRGTITGSTNTGGIVGSSVNNSTLKENFVIRTSINGTSNYGAIAGNYSTTYQTLSKNYYYNMTIRGTEKTSGVAFGSGSSTSDSQGRGEPVYRVLLHLVSDVSTSGSIAVSSGNVDVETDTINYFASGARVNLVYSGSLPRGYRANYTMSTNGPTVTYSGYDAYFTMPSKEVLVNEVSTAVATYTISYVLNGGTNPSDAPKSYTINNSTVSLPDPSRTGYIFEGWFENSQFSGSPVPGYFLTSTTTLENKTFYAMWTPITYYVKFNGNGHSGSMSNQTFTYDEEKALSSNAFTPTADFVKWTTNSDGSGTSYTNGQKVKNLTSTNGATINLYANWGYSITYYIDGVKDNTLTPKSYDGSQAVTLPTPAKSGYTFVGWYDNSSFAGNTFSTIPQGSTGNKTLYGKWRSNNAYTVIYHADNGTDDQMVYEYEYGTTYKAPSPPSSWANKNGYGDFRYWWTDGDGYYYYAGKYYANNNITDLVRPGRVVHLYAKWKIDLATNTDIVVDPIPDKTWTPYSSPNFTVTVRYKDQDISDQLQASYRNHDVGVATLAISAKSAFDDVYTGELIAHHNVTKSNYYGNKKPTKKDLVYNGQAQNLIQPNTYDVISCNSNGTCQYVMLYSLDGVNYSSRVPSATDIGNYTIYYMVAETINYYGVSGSVRSQIKIKPTVTAPVDKNSAYSGEAQELIIAGSTDAGKMLYSLDGTNYSEDIPTATDIGTYTVYYKIGPTDTSYSVAAQPIQATIIKPIPTVTPPGEKEIPYCKGGRGCDSKLVTAGTTNFGTLLYSLDGETFSEDIPTGFDVGTYTIYYKVEETNRWYGVSGSVETIIKKNNYAGGLGRGSSFQPPIPINLTYNGEEQELVWAGGVSVTWKNGDGEFETTLYTDNMYYSLDGETFSEDIPTATNAGAYTVYYWYKLSEEEKEHYNEPFDSVLVVIRPADVTLPIAKELTYNGEAQELVTAGSASTGTMQYSLDGETFSEDIPTAINAGTYTVYYRSGNFTGHVWSTIKGVTFATGEEPQRILSLVYNGEPQELLTPGHSNMCTVLYRLGNARYFSEEIPTAIILSGSTYLAYYKLEGDNCDPTIHNVGYVSISKATPNVTAPVAINPVVNGKPQALITAGSTDFGTLLYSLDGTNYSEDIPTATDPGNYTVRYKIEGTEYFNGTTGSVEAEITGTYTKIAFMEIIENEGKKYVTLDGNSSTTDFNISNNFNAETVTLNRTFPTGNGYSTLVLPFEVNTANLTGVSSILSFYRMGINKETGILQVEMNVLWADTSLNYADVPANTPLMVQMSQNTLQIDGPVVFKETQEPMVTSGKWAFIGTYAYKLWDSNSDEYGRVYGFAGQAKDGISAGEFVKFGDEVHINPMRAYLRRNQTANAPRYGAASTASIENETLPDRINVVIVEKDAEEEHTTVIGTLDTRTGEIRMNGDTRTFDLKGRNVGKQKAKSMYLKKTIKP